MIDLESKSWANALREGLGAQHVTLQGGGSITCFKAAIFRVAYADFLIGSPSSIEKEAIAHRIEVAKSLSADLVRLQTSSEQNEFLPIAVNSLGTIAIPSLDAIDFQRNHKFRRATNRRKKSSLVIRAGKNSDGALMHQLYLSTLRRHKGKPRYSQRYFELIAPSAASIAEIDGRICGFICLGFQRDRVCYMHGAHSVEAREHYASDQLFLHALSLAKIEGKSRFDFLSSPPGQASLKNYKKSWGGEEQPQFVSDIALNPLRARSFRAALRISNILSSFRIG